MKRGIVQGDTYRLTVLTPSLLRLEYSGEGIFEDRGTQSVICRDFEVPEFVVQRVENGTGIKRLILETSELKLTYDGKVFSAEGYR